MSFELPFPWEKEPSKEEKYRELERKDWDSYFMGIVYLTAKQSPCLKKGVGAVLVKGRRVIAGGYNGPPAGIAHCKSCVKIDEDTKSYSACPAVHAEINCLSMAARYGVSVDGSTLYCIYFPCQWCAGALINAGIKEVIYEKPPVDNIAVPMILRAGIKIKKLNFEER